MRIVGGQMLTSFRDRTLNVHPSLLPAFPGTATRSLVRWQPV